MPPAPTSEALPSRPIWQKAVFLASIAAAVLIVPYFVPVTPSVSRSYLAGFSNRAALVLFVLGAAAFALWTRGNLASSEQLDKPLTTRVLILSTATAAFLAFLRVVFSPHGPPGNEAYFFLNRQHLLVAGIKPYLHFDFPYGPLLLYPPAWIASAFHLSQVHGYDAWLVIQWTIGTAMIWFVVRSLDLALTWRLPLFLLLFLTQIGMVRNGGANYTPVRAYAAACLIVAAYALWRRSANPWIAALASIAAVAIGLAISLEQAIGITVGLLAYFVLLAIVQRNRFPWTAVAIYAAGSLLCFGVAARAGMFITFRAFASGGYSYPVLPSPTILTGLFAYIIAGVLLILLIYQRHWNSVLIPLALGGYAMLPNPFGRCDFYHITAAMPAYIAGAAAICAMPSLRRWWLPMAYIFIFFVPFMYNLPQAIQAHIPGLPWYRSSHTATSTPASNLATLTQNLPATSLPCDRTYYAPTADPAVRPPCLDTGYYVGLQDVVSLESIDRKLSEFRQHTSDPLLLKNEPLEVEFAPQQNTLEGLHFEAVAPWVPKPRNPPVTYQPVIDYIHSHYAPGPVVGAGAFRIWYRSAQ